MMIFHFNNSTTSQSAVRACLERRNDEEFRMIKKFMHIYYFNRRKTFAMVYEIGLCILRWNVGTSRRVGRKSQL